MENDKFQEMVLQQFERLNTRFDNLETKVDKLDNNVDNLETKVDNLETKVDNLETKVDNLETKVDKIDASQVRMETELTEKVRGLYDAREIAMDYFVSIKNLLAKLENKQEVILFGIHNLEAKQNEQDRELRLLRVEQK